MSCIVYQTDKRTGISYAYESISYWDKEKQQPRSKRKYIGKVDPVTKEIIPSKKNSKQEGENTTQQQDRISPELISEIKAKEKTIKELEERIYTLETKCNELTETIRKIRELTGDI